MVARKKELNQTVRISSSRETNEYAIVNDNPV
jgi:hypothetical protein